MIRELIIKIFQEEIRKAEKLEVTKYSIGYVNGLRRALEILKKILE